MLYYETKARTFGKTVTWRIIATLITWATIYFFSGKFFESFKITIVAALVSMAGYYVHERFWNMIHWGKEVK